MTCAGLESPSSRLRWLKLETLVISGYDSTKHREPHSDSKQPSATAGRGGGAGQPPRMTSANIVDMLSGLMRLS